MKLVVFVTYDTNRAEELAHAMERVMQDSPQGVRIEVIYALTAPLPGFTAGAAIIAIAEVESSEALTSVLFPASLVGARCWPIPAIAIEGTQLSDMVRQFTR